MTLSVMRSRILSAVVGAAFLGACGLNAVTQMPMSEPAKGSVSPSEEILFLAPGPENDARYLPAFRGAQVSLAVASLTGVTIDLTWVEVPTDASSWTPPDAAAAIVAPGTPERMVEGLSRVLEMPTVSLTGSEERVWPTFVAGTSSLASRMLDAAGPDPCLVSSGGGGDLARLLRSAEVRRVSLGEAVADPSVLRTCSGLLWAGGADGAARLDAALAAADSDEVDILATDAIRDGSPENLATLASIASRILVASRAIDVSTRLDLQSRRFVQDYQSQVGLPPGPFSVEAWDAAGLLARVLGGDGRWPETYSGVGGVYDLTGGAEREIYLYRLIRGGWRAATDV